MTTSEPRQAFVWTWLPHAEDPVVAGRLDVRDGLLYFRYGRSYLERPEALPVYLPELPLARGPIPPPPELGLQAASRTPRRTRGGSG